MGSLNDKQIRGAKLPEGARTARLSDGGGLFLRLHAGGLKRWAFRYRIGSKEHWVDLGVYPETTLAHARQKAADLTTQRAQGRDPVAERAEAKREASAAAAAARARMTIQELFDRWCKVELSQRKDGGAETARGIAKDALPLLGGMYVDTVKRKDVARVLDAVAERGARRMANRLHSELRQMFRFAVGRGVIELDPTDKLPKPGGRETVRTRVLTDDEIRQLARRLEAGALPRHVTLAVYIMLATGVRVGEVSKAEWRRVDLDAGTWTIPAEHTKNGNEHTVYLSEFATGKLAELRSMTGGTGYLLPGRDGGCFDDKTITKAVKDRQRSGAGLAKRKASDELALPGGPWTPHDLRRTAATMMGSLGVRPDVIERTLNHVEPNRIVRTYQHQELKDEQREAWRILGERLDLLTREDADNVLTLPRRVA